MIADLTNEELNAIKNAVSLKKSIIFHNNEYCVLQSIDEINKNITCSIRDNDATKTIPFSEIIEKKYALLEGGSKSRKRLSRKRKGKKSYKKKKYGKTKKSRRFRRSVRSRR